MRTRSVIALWLGFVLVTHRFVRGEDQLPEYPSAVLVKSVYAVDFDPTGKKLVSTSEDGTVSIWDREKRETVLTISIGQRAGQASGSIAYSPDGNWILAGIGHWRKPGVAGTIALFDAKTGKPIKIEESWHKGGTFDVAFSPNGQLLASVGYTPEVILMNSPSLEVKHKLVSENNHSTYLSVAFSKDNSLIAAGSGDDGTAEIWEVASGKHLRSLKTGGEMHTHSLAFSPNGQFLVAATGVSQDNAQGGAIVIYDLTQPEDQATPTFLTASFGSVYSVAFSPDGKYLASAGVDRYVRLWDWKARKEVASWKHDAVIVTHVAFSKDGSMLASSDINGVINIWTLKED